MVAGPGFEPRTEAYETSEMPFLYPAITVVGVQGFEPWTLWSQTRCATRLRHTPNILLLMERDRRIELLTEDWKSAVLPLN